MSATHESLTIRIVRKFLESNLSMVFILVSIAAGRGGPGGHAARGRAADHRGRGQRDGLVSRPHAPQDVEQLVSTPLEKMLLQIPGVEYVYSRSMPGQSIVTVRFYVGQPLEPSYVKLIRKLNENMDRIDAGRGGMGGQADRRGRRADRHLHPHQRLPRRLRAAAHGG